MLWGGAKQVVRQLTRSLLDVRLGGGDLGDGDAVRGAGDIAHVEFVEEVDRHGVPAVFSAHADL